MASRLLKSIGVNVLTLITKSSEISNLPRWALLLALIPGCFEATPLVDETSETEGDADSEGEAESQAATETEGEAGSEGASESEGEAEAESDGDSSTGTDDPGDGTELLSNGSFEAWAGGTPEAWTDGDAAVEETLVDAVDGDRALRAYSTIYKSVGQRVATPLPAGSCLELDIAVRWESGATEAPVVQLLGKDELDMDHEIFTALEWSADGQWRNTEASFVTAEAWTSFSLHAMATASVEQTFAVDGASLRLVPCT